MSRRMNWSLSLCVMAFCLAWFVPGGPTAGARTSGSRSAAIERRGEHGRGRGRAAGTEDINPLEAEAEPGALDLVVFVLLMVVLGRFAWKPLLAALHNREQHLEHVLLETERARNESEANLAEHRKLMARAADEVRGILDKARQEAQATADRSSSRPRPRPSWPSSGPSATSRQARDQALAEIWEKTADMAVSVAGRVLSKELNDTEHRRLLDAAIKELPAAPASNGQGGKRA